MAAEAGLNPPALRRLQVRTLKQASNELADKQAELKFALLSERQQADKLAEQIVQVR